MTTKTARKVNPHIGSDCDGFLREEGCPRRSNSEPPCRPNIEPGVEADV